MEPQKESTPAPESPELIELERGLSRIRGNWFGVLLRGLFWGALVWTILLVAIAGLFYGLQSFDLLPAFDLEAVFGSTKIIAVLICSPLILGPVIAATWGILRSRNLSRRIIALNGNGPGGLTPIEN